MRLGERIKREFLRVFPAFVFFFFSFHIINITERTLFKMAGITPYSFIEVTLAAALVAKIFLVLDHLPFIERFRTKPLFYPILWKTFIYWIVEIFVRLSIRISPFIVLGQPLEDETHLFLIQQNWHLFFSIQSFYLLLLFIYVSARELTIAIGPAKIRLLFFGPKK